MNNALRNQVVIDLKNAIAPIVLKKVQHINMPDIKGKKSGISYQVSKIHVDLNPVNPEQIGVLFQEPSTIRLSGNTISAQGSATIKGKLGHSLVTVEAKIKVKKANLAVGITLTSANDKPNIKISESRLNIAKNDIGIEVKSRGVLNKIINFVVDLLKGHVINSLASTFQSNIPPSVTGLVNQMLNALPADIRINDKIYMKYQFPIAPTVRNGYLFTGIVAYLHPAGDPNPPPGPVSQMPDFDANNSKNIQFFLSDYVVRSAISTAYELGVMKIQVNHELKDREVAMVCSITKLPDFKFAGSIQVTADGSCAVAVDKDPDPKFEVSATLQLNLTEKLEKAAIYFRVDKFGFTRLDFKIIRPIDIQWFMNSINELFAIIIGAVNEQLGKQGIPLPIVKEVDYNNSIQYIGNGFIMIGTDPIFHFNMDGIEEGIIDYSSEAVIVNDEDWIEEIKE